MINLVTIKQAERHLREDIDETTIINVYDLEFKIQQASQITLDYYKIVIPEQTSPVQDSPTYDLWSGNPDAIPFDVRAFCLLVLGALWKDRESDTADVISEAVQRLGRMRRLPTLA